MAPYWFWRSICYKVLPFMFDCQKRKGTSTEVATGSNPSLVLVIWPLIALMIDQVRILRCKDVRAAIVASGAGSGVDQELCATEDDFLHSSFLFCTPEWLVGSKWRDLLESPVISERIVAVAVDEAHCVSKW